MPDSVLVPTSPLGGFDRRYTGLRLRERVDITLVSAAIPLNSALPTAFDQPLPRGTASALTDDGDVRIVASMADQFLILLNGTPDDPETFVQNGFSDPVYTTDQTGAWVILELSGAGVRRVLERICPLDLHPETFPVGSAARTVLEHMGAFVIRTDADQFLLMSASSSAKSFLHALETSITNVI